MGDKFYPQTLSMLTFERSTLSLTIHCHILIILNNNDDSEVLVYKDRHFHSVGCS
jgi:hypothetical protein